MALFGTSKISMETGCCNSVGSGSMLDSLKVPKIKTGTANGYLSYVAAFVAVNAFMADLVVFVSTGVLLVLAMRGLTQIIPSIVSRIGRFMVNLIGRPASCHNDESQSMDQIFFACNGQGPIFHSSTADT